MVNVAGNQVEFMETGRRPVAPLAGLPTAATAPSRNRKPSSFSQRFGSDVFKNPVVCDDA
jgi:hypothetical protein